MATDDKGKKSWSFYGTSKRETVTRIIVMVGVMLAYIDPVLYAQFCSAGR